MSETPGHESPLREQERRTKARRITLEPALASLALQAKATYDLLRRHAEHVSEVERDHPLRYQQVHSLRASGAVAVAADYLMINLGKNHDLTLYQNRIRREDDFAWRFSRSYPLGSRLRLVTKVEERASPRQTLYADDGGVMSIDVETYDVAEDGSAPLIDELVSTYFNDWTGAEAHIDAFAADLTDAAARYSRYRPR